MTPLLRRACQLLLSPLLVLAGTQLAACGDDGSGSAGPAFLRLGTGEATFEELPDDRHLQLVAGSQGGHHVWLSMRAQGLDPASTRFTLDVIPTAPAPPAHSELELTFEPVDDPSWDPGDGLDREGWVEFVGWPARVLAPECAVGKPVKVVVQLSDDSGASVQDEIEIIPDPPKAGFFVECKD